MRVLSKIGLLVRNRAALFFTGGVGDYGYNRDRSIQTTDNNGRTAYLTPKSLPHEIMSG